MKSEIVRAALPEEREFSEKVERLSALEQQLADSELDLTTLQAQVSAFERHYFSVVGERFVRIDGLELQIAEARLCLDPGNEQLREQVAAATAKAAESAAMPGAQRVQPSEFLPSADLKSLYRSVALMVHPDRTTDPEQQVARGEVFADASRAYREGDASRLRSILSEWRERPENIVGEDLAHKLIRLIRRINQVERRLTEALREITALRQSEAFLLKVRVDLQAENGIDLLGVTAQQADLRLAELEATKAALDHRARRL